MLVGCRRGRHNARGTEGVSWRPGALHFFILFGVAVSSASAQMAAWEGRRVIDIQFSPAQELDPADLARALSVKKGETLHGEDISRSIDGLFATGRFEDIVVEGEPSGPEVVVRFVTTPTWFVGGVSVEGKAPTPPNRGQLVNTAQFSLGAPFHDEDVKTAVEAMKSLLRPDGLQ